MKHTALDLICIGRAGVDLYGEQVGGRLEDMGSFAKYVGGSPANTAIGTARLVLKSALLTRVGDEHMGHSQGSKVVLDIDYRPNLWNLAGHGDGEPRFIADQGVSQHLQKYLADCDLIVGTEEEFQIAGGTDDTLSALTRVRELSDAVLVCKRGAIGCRVCESAVDGWDTACAISRPRNLSEAP